MPRAGQKQITKPGILSHNWNLGNGVRRQGLNLFRLEGPRRGQGEGEKGVFMKTRQTERINYRGGNGVTAL